MKKAILSIAVLLVVVQLVSAKTDGYFISRISGDFARRAVSDTLLDTIYDHEVMLKTGTQAPAGASYKFLRREVTFTLCVNPAVAVPPGNTFTSSVDLLVQYKTSATATIQNKTITLAINYTPNAGTAYKAKDVYVLKDVVWAQVKTVNKNILSLPADDNSLQLHYQYSADKVFPPTASEAVLVNSFLPSTNNGYLKLQWKELPWAERYDVEWTFIDNYSSTGSERPASELSYDFRHNSTRVSTQNTELEIPLVFEKGYVLTRVRAVGLKGTNSDEWEYGRWSAFTNNTGTGIPTDGKAVHKITAAQIHEADKMNWQFRSVFAGDDLNKESIVYMDGTMRAHQQVSNAQSDLNLLVKETIYDHQGRPAIQTLPAAVKPVATTSSSTTTTITPGSSSPFAPIGYSLLPPGTIIDLGNIMNLFSYSTTHPKISYQKNFNRNAGDQPYTKADFDLDAGTCDASPGPFSSTSGAGKYYSPANADATGFNKYIPDAEGYPFVQFGYTPDKTNRLTTIAQPGATLKKGSGHEVKIYYGTPAQDELDRLFGNDAGNAARYKKEMVIDENGQAHVTYKDIADKIIATALSGDAPEAYEPVSSANAAITLHLLEENNRIDEATNSLVSEKSLLVSQRTNMVFNYTLTPPSHSGRYCNNTTFCYDCVYDLNIDVRNECGTVVWHDSRRIGTLDGVNTCASSPVTINHTAQLDPGNYFITKRLTVNEEAINAYIDDFNNHICELPLTPFRTSIVGDPCEATCTTCPQTTADRIFSMRDASGSHNVTLKVTMRGSSDGNCMRYCNTGPASTCASAMEMMLADVSPGGQYAEYNDTTNRDFPMGITDPTKFPLSVLNDGNQLPVMNASWRIPAFDYQNRDGSIAYIEISADNLPSHRERDVIVRNGKRYVKPAYLNDVRDFIRYWQPQWAEALVVYHPEYPYYMWCINKKESYTYDSLMRNTASYSEAASRNLVNHRTLACVNDPFFRDGLPADAVTMNNSLLRFVPLTGYPELNIEEAVYMAVNYNNINANPADVNSNVRGKSLYTFGARVNDKQWSFYREFYLLKKAAVHDAARRNWIISPANNYFDNAQIGTNTAGTVANPLYADRTKRFIDNRDAITFLPVDIDTFTEETMNLWRDAAMAKMKSSCGGCGISYELLSFFNALAIEKKVKQASITLPDVTPVVLSRGLVQALPNRTALQYQWTATVSPATIQYKISTGGTDQCSITLTRTNTTIDWDSIVRFDCFTATGTNQFTLRGVTARDSMIQITGSSTCMNFTDCPTARACVKQPAADDLAVLMQWLFQRNRYRSTYLTLRGSTGYSPHYGEALRAFAPNATRVVWKMKTISTPDTLLTAAILVTDPTLPPNPLMDNQRMAACDVILRVVTPGYRLSQVAAITDISQAPATGCTVNAFILTARTSTGATFKIYGISCIPLYKCCNNNNPPASGGLCCWIPTPKVTYEPNCGQQADAIIETNRRRTQHLQFILASDTLRTGLINHCLAAAESLNAAYSDNIHQVTLFYYDRSGQLVKTIPPQGVVVASTLQIGQTRSYRSTGGGTGYYPAHTMATTYRYNSYNQLIEKTSPDGGTTRYCYDYNGRLIMTQDAAQLAANACSYNLYDSINRITEKGRRNYSGAIPASLGYGTFKSGMATAIRSEVTAYTYDALPAAATAHMGSTRRFMRNRLAAVSTFETLGTTNHITYFDYDVLGNTRTLVHDLRGIKALAGTAMSAPGSEIKKINYRYNPLTGKVSCMWYQPMKADQFLQWYKYDDDGRILQIQTGTNPYEMESLRETEANYYYYPHGPVAREETGTEKIQGIDYAYTITGKLKAINSGSATKEHDMGADGTDDATYGHFLPDVFGEVLNFFDGDYKSIGSSDFVTETSGPVEDGFSKPLYNGFIRNAISTIQAPALPVAERMSAKAYRYDQASRLSEMQLIFASPDANTINGTFSNSYKMRLRYDSNGNIDSLLRRSRTGEMDNLDYTYNSGTNRLQRITDFAGSTATDNDLGNRSYSYDAAGRLTNDGTSTLVWNNGGTLKQYGANTYGYDAGGHRSYKRTSRGIEFYVTDAGGKTIATYQTSGSELRVKDYVLYGTSRIGVNQVNKLLNGVTYDVTRDSLLRGLKRYEFTNHVGDVQAVLSDKRVRTGSTITFDLIAATDYYPFGMIMPGRSTGNRTYRYGYQGMESDDDAVSGDDNEYTTDFRQYDPRVGRWMSIDPMETKFAGYSPYNAMLNNPVTLYDASGADPTEDRTRATRLRPEDERLLAEMLEWGDDPIAGIEEPPVDEIDALAIRLQRLEGNDDPLAGLPMESPAVAEPERRRPVHRRHRGGTAEILRVDEAPFEDEVVTGRAPRRSTSSSSGPRPETELERDVRITREAFSRAGDVMDAGGMINDAVQVADALNDARSAGEVITTTRAVTDVIRSGSSSVSGMGMLGAGISVVNMVGDIYDDANALVDGDIGTGTYIARSACNITGGTVGVIPVVGAPLSRGIGYFRDWVAPRPEH